MLTLLALGWCLLLAPALHRLTHTHGVQHTHEAGGSFEHHDLAFAAPSNALEPVLLAQRFTRLPLLTPAPAILKARHSLEQPQAP